MGRKVVIAIPKPGAIGEDASVQEILEATRLAQDDVSIIQKAVKEDISPEGTSTQLREKRDEFIMKYYGMGLTIKTIKGLVEAKAKETGWTAITELTIRKIVMEHYKTRGALLRGAEGRENEAAMREAFLEQQEQFLEKLVLTYNKHETNHTFKSLFEQTQLATLIGTLRQQIMENRNWNESRKNPFVQNITNSLEVNVFETTGEKMAESGRSEAMIAVISQLESMFSDSGVL